MNPKTQIVWYVARNAKGEYYSGQDGDGGVYWDDVLQYARWHDKIGPVKAAVTKWVKRNPGKPIPEILEWTIDIATARVIDVAGETDKRIKRANAAKVQREERDRQDQLKCIEEQRARLAAEEEKLRR